MTGAASEASMDCEQCEKGLLELSYGELDEAAAAATRSHLERCAPCRAAFHRIELGRAFARRLELEPAPSMEKVLAAAREQAALNRAAREQPAAAPAPPTPQPVRAEEQSGLSAWLQWLGALVMGPQLGVVTVLLLVVGIGLWYLPQLGGGPGRDALPLLEPDPQQTSETTALAPAEPLQLSHDPRTGRVTVEEPADESGDTLRAARRGGEPRPAELRPPTAEPPPADERAEEALAVVEQAVPVEQGPGLVEADSLPEMTSAAGAVERAPMPSTEEPAPRVLAPGGSSTGSAPFDPTAAPAEAPPPPPPSPRTAPAEPATTPRAAPTYDTEGVPGPRGDELAAAALHGQARQLAAAGRCADSVARYQQLQARHPSYPESGRASLEMAECLRRLGRTSEARVALDRAARSPVATVAGAARREIVELDTADRAASEAAVAEPTGD